MRPTIDFSRDEVVALVEELSKLPYRDVHQLLPVLIIKINEYDEKYKKPEIIT